MTTRSTPCSRSKVAVEWWRSWKRMRRRPARLRKLRKRRVRLAGSRSPEPSRTPSAAGTGPTTRRPSHQASSPAERSTDSQGAPPKGVGSQVMVDASASVDA